MTRNVSPAAAAAISRLLDGASAGDARLKKAREFRKGIETEGFYASPNGDHVRVEYVPDPFSEEDTYRAQIEEGLAHCKSVLLNSHYDVREVEGDMAFSGGMRTMPMLEVRRASWTQR